ncbi:hypothetical protein WKW79_33470 [Variovorax robiniae]|uniref:Resolvase HTH domain-containing protein n=1 Tax=Variovorax robiniae TaxID=1836199 RepID=A0ABU8XHZ4_9BURK
MGSASTVDSTGRQPALRLRDALAQLTALNTPEAPTASALCQLAGVSRNALYRYHPDILHELHKLQRQRHHDPGPATSALQQLRHENEELHQHMAKQARCTGRPLFRSLAGDQLTAAAPRTRTRRPAPKRQAHTGSYAEINEYGGHSPPC